SAGNGSTISLPVDLRSSPSALRDTRARAARATLGKRALLGDSRWWWRARARTRSDPRARSEARTRGLGATLNDGGATPNGFDELIQSEDPSGQVRTFAYDELGRQVSVTDAAGVTQWIYDQGVNALGRLSETVAPPTPENPFGQREQYTYESGGRGLLARFDAIIDGEEYPVTFTYDDLGRPKRIHYPNVGGGAPVVVEHTYSTSGILTGLDEVGTGTSRQLWRMQQVFQGHLLARETFGNGASTTYGYDPDRHWIDSIETTFGGAQVQALEYSRNAGGLITARHATGRDLREYTYDALNRLQSTTTTPVGGAAEQVTYTYDTLGNITHTGQYAVGYHGTRKHQVTTVGPNSYQY